MVQSASIKKIPKLRVPFNRLKKSSASPCEKAHELESDPLCAVMRCKASAGGRNMLCAHSDLNATFDNKQVMRDIVEILDSNQIISSKEAAKLLKEIDQLKDLVGVLDMLKARVRQKPGQSQPQAENGNPGIPRSVLLPFDGVLNSMSIDSVSRILLMNMLNSVEIEPNADSFFGFVGVVSDIDRFNRQFRICEVLIGADLITIRAKLIGLAEKHVA